MTTQAYTSTVTSPVLAGAGLALGAATGGAAAAAGTPAWASAVIALIVAAAAIQFSVVHLSVSGAGVRAGYGVWSPLRRRIAVTDVVEASSPSITWPQVFGIGIEWHLRIWRLTIKPGPMLQLRLRSGEVMRVSTRDPDAARRLIARTDQPAKGQHQ